MSPSRLSRAWTQFFPPKPTFVEEDVPDQTGRVHLVTGANSGLGRETARILYGRNATVYVTARSQARMQPVLDAIRQAYPSSRGALVFLALELGDLDQVRAAAAAFLAQAPALHVLYNNAGAMGGDPLRRTAQGHELTMGVNCVGTLLLTALLTPLLQATARRCRPATNAVRVVWLSSYGVDRAAVPGAGIPLDDVVAYDQPPGGGDGTGTAVPKAIERYALSKAGVWALGVEYARLHRDDAIVSLPVNPGNLHTELARDMSAAFRLAVTPLLYAPATGASTVLYAAVSPDVTLADSGGWMVPFGRKYPIRDDLVSSTKPAAEGGTGGCAAFYAWNMEQIQAYL